MMSKSKLGRELPGGDLGFLKRELSWDELRLVFGGAEGGQDGGGGQSEGGGGGGGQGGSSGGGGQ